MFYLEPLKISQKNTENKVDNSYLHGIIIKDILKFTKRVLKNTGVMPIRCTLIVFIAVYLNINVGFSQIQLRLPFDCERVSKLDDQEFSHFVENRNRNPFLVYEYLESAEKKKVICMATRINLHIEFARAYQQYLGNKNSIEEMVNILEKSAGDSSVLFVTYSELLLQYTNQGRYFELDSLRNNILWNTISDREKSILARRLYFINAVLFEDLNTDGGNLLQKSLSSKIKKNDPIIRFLTDSLPLKNSGVILDSLYKTNNVVEANFLSSELAKRIIKTGNIKTLIIEFDRIKGFLSSVGFKRNRELMGYFNKYYESEDDEVYDLIKFAMGNKYKSKQQQVVVPLWLNIVMVCSVLLLMYSLVSFIYIKMNYMKIKRELAEEIIIAEQSLRIRERQLKAQASRLTE